MKNTKTVAWRTILFAVFALLFLWSCAPVFSGIMNGVVAIPIVLSLGGMVLCVCFHPKKGEGRTVGWLIGSVTAAAVIAGSFFTFCMVQASAASPPSDDATVIVLGAKINGDRPSRMLGDRLKSAAAFLEEHPDSRCVVTGGQGSDETVSEAEVMRRYLLSSGIAEDRIFTEDQATDTHENLDFSMRLIREQGLNENVVIATQVFHQYRASVLADRFGATAVGAISCRTPLHLLLYYWVRECAAICRLSILGY